MINKKNAGTILLNALVVAFLSLLMSCSTYDNRGAAENFIETQTAGAESAETKVIDDVQKGSGVLPERFQNPSFLLENSDSVSGYNKFTVSVGADISSNRGPVTLRDILKRLAVLKKMNVSWSNDVDQMALVDVDIRAEDDFYQAIDNILRQLDYFYEIEGNSIVVKYRETKAFTVAMPFLKANFNTGVGGDVLGSGDVKFAMKGLLELTNEGSDDAFDIWSNIESNLDEILHIYTEIEVEDTIDTALDRPNANAEATQNGNVAEGEKGRTRTRNKGALGYYMIDKPVGIITVTAPRTLVAEIETYINKLKTVLYRQISIEAKIVEVTTTGDDRTGLNWESLLNGSTLSGIFDFQKLNPLYYAAGTQNRFFTLQNLQFSVILDAMKEQGHIEVLANPKISVMNGQPALISVGTDVKYVSSIDVTVDEGERTYSAETSSVVSGLGLAVVATIMSDDEIILNLTPVTSELLDMNTADIGNDGGQVGLPVVRIREMSSTVRVKDGHMLVVGGLIDSNNEYSKNGVVGAGDISIGDKLFGYSGHEYEKKEMVVLLRPVILN